MRTVRLPAMLLLLASLLTGVVLVAAQPAPVESQPVDPSAGSAMPAPQRLDQADPFVVHELTSLAMLRDQFNHDFGRPRLILLLSPT